MNRTTIALFFVALLFLSTTTNAASENDAAGSPPVTTDGASANASEASTAYATDTDPQAIAAGEEADKIRQASSTTVRRFHEVLDELLAEFGYDVKMGQIKGLKNLAIRKVEVSSAIPDTYRDYTRLLISERIRENSEIKLINCLPCSAKTSRLIDGKIVITSPSTNIGELKSAAETLNIENFMDIILVYHSTHMVLALQIFKSDTQELTWARTYNSETIRSRYQKLAIDYSQVAKSRPGEDYQPEYRILIGVGGGSIPNASGNSRDSSMLSFHLRSTEKFDNRRSEFGMMASLYATLNSLQKNYPVEPGTGTKTSASSSTTSSSTAEPAPFSYALGLFGLYSHNFLGAVESYNEVRQGVHLGAGFLFTSGYFGPTGKLGWDFFFGRRFSLAITGVYISPSQILLNNQSVSTKGGMGAEVVMSFNY